MTLIEKTPPEPPQSVLVLVFVSGLAIGACTAVLVEFFAYHAR